MALEFFVDMAVRRLLRTPAEEKRLDRDMEWHNRANSDDKEIVKEAFKEKWDEIKQSLSKDELLRLKKKLGIK